MRNLKSLYKSIILLITTIMLASCASMEEFTESVESFTQRVKSQNTLMNHSRVMVTGEYSEENLTVAAAESHLLTPVQLKSVRDNLRFRAVQAHQRGDTQESRALSDVSTAFEEQFKTQNDVLVFRLENKTYDPIDLSGARILLVGLDQSRVPHAIFPERGLEMLNEEAFVVDRASNERVEYTNGKLSELPALTTQYKAVIVPRLRAGQYQAIVSGVSGSEQRLAFNIEKR